MVKKVFLLTAVLFFPLAAFADVELEKIVVTASRYFQDIDSSPASLSVIGEEQIENSQAKTVVDLLRQQPGLMVRDYYGNGVKASVDIRGFGESADSNLLVLIDGRRVNSIDLSGVDWMQIPLERIQRIEILRGGQGSVLYGDNAQAGVINIITKKGKAKPTIGLEVNTGSYQANGQRVSLTGSKQDLDYDFVFSRSSTNGYRQNSYLDAKDFSGRINYAFTDSFSLDLSGSYHDADFGLPGALLETDLAKMSRRETKFPDDDAGEKDWYVMAIPKLDWSEKGVLETNISFRRRYVDTIWGSYLLFSSTNSLRIDTLGLSPRYTLEHRIARHKNKLIAGLDFYKNDSLTSDFDAFGQQTGESDIDKISLGGYIQDELSLLENLFLSFGWRYEKARYEFDYTDLQGWYTVIDTTTRITEQAYKFGLSYNYKEGSKIFANVSRSFRFPMVEEFVIYDFSVFPFYRRINPDLKAQKSVNYELGLEHEFRPGDKTGINVYLMKVTDEIFFNPFSFTNENYDKTRHAGLESFLETKLTQKISLFANYSFTKAAFRDGPFKDNDIPAVPRHKATLGLRYSLWQNLGINMTLNYVGRRYFISDMNNQQSPMADYLTVDCKFSYQWKGAKFYLALNNIWNEKYEEFGALSAFTGQKAIYPSAGRNFQAGISWDF